jgi:hypothetical protein
LWWGIAISFLCVSVLPGALPRYTMPLLAPAAWLIALLLTDKSVRLPRWLHAPRLPLIAAVACAAVVAAYVVFVVPHRAQRAKVRNIAAQLNASLPRNEPLYAIDTDYQPALFYVREPIVYLVSAAELPSDARCILIRPERELELTAVIAERGQAAAGVQRLTDYRNKQIILYEIAPSS